MKHNVCMNEVIKALKDISDPQKAASSLRFFKTGPGEYGEGDRFRGITVPEQRAIARRFKTLDGAVIAELLKSFYHEDRLTGLFILRHRFEAAMTRGKRLAGKRDEKPYIEAETLVKLYLDNLAGVNNWDLVDSSAHYILGRWLLEREESTDILDELLRRGDLWSIRIAVMSTFAFIRAGQFDLTLDFAERLIDHPHDLIHKAVGWMLREIGNRDLERERVFLDKYASRLPRTMLRYAIEKFPEELRLRYLKG